MRDYSQQNKQLQETLISYLGDRKVAEIARKSGHKEVNLHYWFKRGERVTAISVEKLRTLESALDIPSNERQTLPQGFGADYLRIVGNFLRENYDEANSILEKYGLPSKTERGLELDAPQSKVLQYFFNKSGKLKTELARALDKKDDSIRTILNGQLGKCPVFHMRELEECLGVPITYRLSTPGNFREIYAQLFERDTSKGSMAYRLPKIQTVEVTSHTAPIQDTDYGILPHSIVSSLPPAKQAIVANLLLYSLYQVTHNMASGNDNLTLETFKRGLDKQLVVDTSGILISLFGDSQKLERFFSLNSPANPQNLKTIRRKK